jgi:hypothetical protein
MGQNFKETAHLNIDQDKYQNNLEKIQKLSRALKTEITYLGHKITLQEFATKFKAEFESKFQNEFDVELADKMALVYKHIVTEGN